MFILLMDQSYSFIVIHIPFQFHRCAQKLPPSLIILNYSQNQIHSLSYLFRIICQTGDLWCGKGTVLASSNPTIGVHMYMYLCPSQDCTTNRSGGRLYLLFTHSPLPFRSTLLPSCPSSCVRARTAQPTDPVAGYTFCSSCLYLSDQLSLLHAPHHVPEPGLHNQQIRWQVIPSEQRIQIRQISRNKNSGTCKSFVWEVHFMSIIYNHNNILIYLSRCGVTGNSV